MLTIITIIVTNVDNSVINWLTFINVHTWCVCVCVCVSHSALSSSLWPHGLRKEWCLCVCSQLLSYIWLFARLLCPWDFWGKNTGLVCHFLLYRIFLTWGQTQVSCIVGRFFIIWAIREALIPDTFVQSATGILWVLSSGWLQFLMSYCLLLFSYPSL